MPKVSVIIPVYGVEKYIERCARSLFEQSLNEIEFIFVDDCTPDKSISLLKSVVTEYPSRISQVRIMRHDVNKGLPAARKTGIMEATGEYVIHCDSDDWVEPNMYEEMYNLAKNQNYDLVICDFRRTDLKEFNKIETGCHSIDKKGFIENCLFQKDHWSLCNKLFSRNLYNTSIVYPEGALGEDMALCIQLINNVRNIGYINTPFYNYYLNTSSITKRKTVDNFARNFYTLKTNTDFIVSYIEDELPLKVDVKRQAILYLRMINSFSLLSIKHLPEFKCLWKEYSQNMPLSFYLNPKIDLYNKILYSLSKLPFYPLKKNRAID